MKLSELQQLNRMMAETDIAANPQLLQDWLLSAGIDPGTLYQELEMTSELVDTHRDTSYSNAHIQLHSHNFYELIYCMNTCGAEYLVGSERYRLQQGDLIFVPPGISHRPLLPETMTQPYQRYVLWLSRKFLEFFASLFPTPFTEDHNRTSMLRTGNTQWEQLGDLFRRGVLEAEQQTEGWEAIVVGNTISLLASINRAISDRTAHSLPVEKPELLDRLMAYVERNYTGPITISELAKANFVSSSTVSHLFKEKMGVSFYRYVTQRRLIAAKTLIEQGLSMEEVSVRSGFQDYSGFFRAFKQEFGISPRQYRTLRNPGNI